MTESFDLVVLGGGTGGYVAAIRAAQLGMKVAVVEKEDLGGTCLHKGCIPSKALLRSAEIYRQTKHAIEYGIETDNVRLNFQKIQERKENTISNLHLGVQGLMKKNNIEVFKGIGRILGSSIFSPIPGTISVEYENGEENSILIPKQVIIATGSSPRTLPNLEIDGTQVLHSDHALTMEELPSSIVIIGAGAIGIEWASMLADFGVEVTIVEYLDRILPAVDEEISKEVERLLKKKGIKFMKGTKVLPESLVKDHSNVRIDVDRNGEIETISSEKILVSVGRKANIENIGLENTDIELENGFIQTNEFCQTKESHIYAIGDVIGGMQLAHVASHEGIVAVEHMANENPTPLNYLHIASCIYSHPEVASIGLTEQQALQQGYNVKVGKFPFKAIGKALVHGEKEGFVKVIGDKETDDILGVHMIGPHVTDMISEASLAMVLNATPWEISQTIHPHPTLSEVIGEAALAVDGKQIHG
ncbi:dihydrolipoyl dehydrogenase [Oceanobacillus piezotolerans]|uniref:Dihydrolipoyl dehydrogenase n=1 Tax=Oceanobacillus piezotolerans TaxID=2448030 RepID=A0A498DM54_9BACI|nr:dihydrolipoyl dehydrogenase [Oceanobacillus piezotolerans]RLL48130.1 dihydrolipoyl dehydrogenase [Oceanobacillus piezotolerans]